MAGVISLLTEDAISLFSSGNFSQQWGLFLNGAPVVVSDNVSSMEYRKQYSVSDYPVEKGSFESFDKVELPFDVRMAFTAGGSLANREALLNSCQAILGDLNLYDAVSPEGIYPNCNVTHMDYRRTAQNGMGLITVNLWLLEIRQAPTAQLSNTKSPTSASPVNGGTAQPVAPTSAQTAKIPAIAGGELSGSGSST